MEKNRLKNTKYLNPLNIWKDFCVSYNIKLREYKIRKRREKLKNFDFSTFSDNCTGGVVCHDLGAQFRTPLINGEFSTDDYLKFLESPIHYLETELRFMPFNDPSMPGFYDGPQPVAKIDDIYWRFTHYSQYSLEEMKQIWNKRKARINWDNLFVIMCQKEGVTLEHMKRFEKLPYKNKLILTYKDFPELKYSFCLKGYENIGFLDNILKYMPGFMKGMKYYDQFDWVEWINSGKIQSYK